MRYIAYGAILAGALVFTISTGHLPRGATASHDQTNDTVDVLKLEEAMDMRAPSPGNSG